MGITKIDLFQKLLILIFLFLAVSGDNNNTMLVGINKKSAPKLQQKNQQGQRVNKNNSFDVYFSSKRRVPNASDPVHNRWQAFIPIFVSQKLSEFEKQGECHSKWMTLAQRQGILLQFIVYQ